MAAGGVLVSDGQDRGRPVGVVAPMEGPFPSVAAKPARRCDARAVGLLLLLVVVVIAAVMNAVPSGGPAAGPHRGDDDEGNAVWQEEDW